MPEPVKTVAMPHNSVSKSKQFLQDFIFGLTTPLRAVGLVFSRPKLLTLSLMPIAATLVLLSLVFYALMAGVAGFLKQWLMTAMHGYLSGYSTSLSIVASVAAGIALVFLGLNSITFIASLISSPFNDWLAESTETAIKVRDPIKSSFVRLVRVFFLDLRKTIVTLTLSIIFTIGLLLPIAGLVFFLGIALLNTLTFVTYPQSRREHGLRDSVRWIFQNLGLSLGFGVFTTVLFGIPVINLFALPIAVVGGTMLYFRK
jgi:CysZ protein